MRIFGQRGRWQSMINICMRFYEIATIKPIKPLTPAQSRIATKKKQVDVAKQALDNERETQHDAARQQRNRLS
jgi:hypothetical protein